MKISTRIAFAAFVVLPVWNSPELLAAPSNAGSVPKAVAAPKVPRITWDNFVSLSWSWSEVFGATGYITTTITVKGNTFSYERSTSMPGGGGGFSGNGFDPSAFSGANTAGLSKNQLSALMRQLNNPLIVAAPRSQVNFLNPYAALNYSDKDNKDQTIYFVCSIDGIPEHSTKIAEFLLDMARQKFPNTTIVPPVTPTPAKANATSH